MRARVRAQTRAAVSIGATFRPQTLTRIPRWEAPLKQSEAESQSPGTAGALAALVIGITINTLGVVFVALRGVGWVGFALMLLGIALLLFAVVRLTADARRRESANGRPANGDPVKRDHH